MATMTQDNTATMRSSLGLLARDSGASLSQRFAAWNESRRTIARITRELNTYTERQLADLGLCRSDIPDVARGYITR